MLTLDNLNALEFYGRLKKGADLYTLRDYLYKSDIYKNGVLYARINNRLGLEDARRVEYVKG